MSKVEEAAQKLADAERLEQAAVTLQWRWLSEKEEWETAQALEVEPADFQPYPVPRPKAEYMGVVVEAYKRALREAQEAAEQS